MKKALSITLCIILCAMLALSISVITAAAADSNSINVYVTITDKDGNLAVAVKGVTVTDTDSDGTLTISDALYCAHETYYDGGAAAGYATKSTEYGLSLDKLWGNANGGSYGYYVNGASAWSLTDTVQEGDYLYAFTYTDLVSWSDKFSTFDQFMGDVDATEGVELTLTYVAEYDESYQPVFAPLANAEILIDGAATGIKTDDNGKATVTFTKNGEQIVSATSEDATITPPAFRANVTGIEEPDAAEEEPDETDGDIEDEPATPDEATPDEPAPTDPNPNAVQTGAASVICYFAIGIMILGSAIIIIRRKHEE